MRQHKKEARRGCNQGRANAVSDEEYTTFGVRLIFGFAAFLAFILLDMALGGAA